VRRSLLLWLTFGALAQLGFTAEWSGPVIDRLIDFQQYRFGRVPAEFDYDATGAHGPVLAAGRPMWRIYVDLFAPSPKLVLIQSSALPNADHYPIALLRDVNLRELKMAVGLKILGGSVTGSAGLLWGAQNKDGYHAVLVSGLDHHVRLVRMSKGRPVELGKGKAAFDEKEWNFLEICSQRDRVAVWINDRLILEARGQDLTTAGRVGLITHADTTAVFDDFHIRSLPHSDLIESPWPSRGFRIGEHQLASNSAEGGARSPRPRYLLGREKLIGPARLAHPPQRHSACLGDDRHRRLEDRF
jgi:hypothetical protein